MRIALAKLLLQQPNLLLLDEPTNHLDLEVRNWLEDYLHNYPHAFVLISHDRFFLDATVDQIAEIWNKRVYFYSGNYAKYLDQKTQRFEQLAAAAKNQRERIEQLEIFINRFRYQATKAKQVQSRIKELEKIERIELPPEEKTIHFTFPQPKPSGRSVVELVGASKSYGTKEVLKNVDLVIERGDRVALVGVNGAGILRPASSKTSANSPPSRPKPNCATYWVVFCSGTTMSSSPSASSPAESATVTHCCGCCCVQPIFYCLMSPPTTSTCEPRMFCSTPC